MDSTGVDALARKIAYRFADPALLHLALTHKSFANESADAGAQHNERLEFLGDAVLDFVISDLLMTRHATLSEGDLSKLRANLVNERGLAEIARELELGTHLRLGRGETASGGRDKDSILSDALEALFAAIYLDSKAAQGTAEIRRVIDALFGERIARGGPREVDYKTELQEWVQRAYKDNVAYRITSEAGPDHEKKFEVAVLFQNRECGRGVGRSKKIAEQAAAREALDAFRRQGREAGS
ncbi:MAG: ribonuclease III [Candidatus Lambdaproteobacteria bacterium]|nr:ribonuclease III [Candidatus Lambdaproteobacteria bacterium]